MMDNALALIPAGDNEQDLEARIDALVGNMMQLAFENEALLRTMIQQTVLEKGTQRTCHAGYEAD